MSDAKHSLGMMRSPLNSFGELFSGKYPWNSALALLTQVQRMWRLSSITVIDYSSTEATNVE